MIETADLIFLCKKHPWTLNMWICAQNLQCQLKDSLLTWSVFFLVHYLCHIVIINAIFLFSFEQLVDSEIVSVSAMTSHVDATLPPPDNISSLL